MPPRCRLDPGGADIGVDIVAGHVADHGADDVVRADQQLVHLKEPRPGQRRRPNVGCRRKNGGADAGRDPVPVVGCPRGRDARGAACVAIQPPLYLVHLRRVFGHKLLGCMPAAPGRRQEEAWLALTAMQQHCPFLYLALKWSRFY